MHCEIFLHVVWTTRDRAELIDAARARWLQRELPRIAQRENAQVLELGVVSTHLHLLLRIQSTTSLPRLLQLLKGGSAHGINSGTASRPADLRWAKGYSVRSVGPAELERIANYIRNQPRHHPAEAITDWNE